MYYMIHTNTHPRPHLTTVPLIAHDFLVWGYRVDRHAVDSEYIKEIRIRETRQNEKGWRLQLAEIWAREALSRKEQSREHGPEPDPQDIRAVEQHLSYDEQRLRRASRLAHDFMQGLAAFGECGCEIHETLLEADRWRKAKPGYTHTPFSIDPWPIPDGPLGLISNYMRLLWAIYYNANVPLPDWADPAITRAAAVTMEFHPHPAVSKKHLIHAANKAISLDKGRMCRVKRNLSNGVFEVVLFVDTGDCTVVPPAMDEYTQDPVPTYQRGEHPPQYA